MAYNLDNFSFEEWVKFVFDHSLEKKDGKNWYWQNDWDLEFQNNDLQVTYLKKFYENPEIVKGEYSWEQIEQGLWFLMASNYIRVHIRDLGIVRLVNDPRINWPLRERCILAMENLYTQLFVDDPIKSASFMWWYENCYDYFMERDSSPAEDGPKVQDAMIQTLNKILSSRAKMKKFTKTEDGLKVQNTMFQTLTKILNSETKYFQLCALHGLGHLRHKDTEQLIRAYLERNPALPEAAKDYAEGCITGTMDRIHIPYECF